MKAKRGAIVPTKGKTRITLYLDNDVIQYFRNKSEHEGKGYQTMINDALHASIDNKRIDSVETLRQVIREELKVINK
ncbi:MAG: hypothetical protein A3F10_04510 [Coxiella sp. RIFCSPHIGHO2_12_FULL_42_15]|nr:MAG: hypothetical protein A3F10_04510 [Coxiella sp. RIFCSPHIGHO2_12_FULL_42_15]